MVGGTDIGWHQDIVGVVMTDTINSQTKVLKCSCHSYNGDTGTVKEILLTSPDGEKTVAIDACIAPVIKKLWDNGIWTIGSCCGHNGKFGFPSIVLSESVDNYTKIRELIAEVDDRHFELSQWKRVLV